MNKDDMANMASSGDFSDECHVCFNDAAEDAFIVCEWDNDKGKHHVRAQLQEAVHIDRQNAKPHSRAVRRRRRYIYDVR